MITRGQKIRLGIFVAMVVALLAGTLILLIGREVLDERPEYTIRVRESVHGLERGSPVKLRGVRVGVVDQIRIDPDNVEIINVTITVAQNTPIKVDHKAVISMQGITGLKFIELVGGTQEAAKLAPGGEIEVGQDLFERLSGDVEGISRQVTVLMAQLLTLTGPENQSKLSALLTSVTKAVERLDTTLVSAHTILEESRTPVKKTLQNLEHSSGHLKQTLDRVSSAANTLEQAVTDAKVAETAADFRATSGALRGTVEQVDLKPALEELQSVLASLNKLVESTDVTVQQNQEAIRITLENLKRTSANLKSITSTLDEKPMIQVFGDEPSPRKLP